MRDYGKISTTIWNSRKFSKIDRDGRLLYFYLHTCPHVNSAGCFVLKEGYACTDLDWPLEDYQRAIESLSKAGLIGYDQSEGVVRLINFFAFDPFTNVNHAKGTVKLVLALPDCEQKALVINDLCGQRFIKRTPELDRAIKGLSKAYRTPEPEPEPEPESTPPSLRSGNPPRGQKEKKAEISKSGERLPPDWKPSKQYETAAVKIGLTTSEIKNEQDRFKDYWTSKAGRNARKIDWLATWRNWCRKAIADRKGKGDNADGSNRSERALNAAIEAGLRGRSGL